MTKADLTLRVLQFTPEELQKIINGIHEWKTSFDDDLAATVETVQDVIELLIRPEYLELFEAVEEETGEDYFEAVFNVKTRTRK